jgi:hypothetical protein
LGFDQIGEWLGGILVGNATIPDLPVQLFDQRRCAQNLFERGPIERDSLTHAKTFLNFSDGRWGVPVLAFVL